MKIKQARKNNGKPKFKAIILSFVLILSTTLLVGCANLNENDSTDIPASSDTSSQAQEEPNDSSQHTDLVDSQSPTISTTDHLLSADEITNNYVNPLLSCGLINENWDSTELNYNELIFFYSLNFLYPNLENAVDKYEFGKNESFLLVPIEDIVLWLNTYFVDIDKEQLIENNIDYISDNNVIEISIGGIGSAPVSSIESLEYSQINDIVEIMIITKSPFDEVTQNSRLTLKYDVLIDGYKYKSFEIM